MTKRERIRLIKLTARLGHLLDDAENGLTAEEATEAYSIENKLLDLAKPKV